MASAWSEEEALVCPVCLDTLKDPATLPCGHSYCLLCIQNHWDKEAGMGKYSCPQCRHVYKPRPSLAKSTVLVEVMEKLRTKSLKQPPSSLPVYLEVIPDSEGPRPTGVYPQLPQVSPRPCPKHNRPLCLFCLDDRESLCEECCQHEHRGHRVLQHEEERRERQKEVLQMQAEVQRRVHETQETLGKLPHDARQHKALVQALQQERLDVFTQLVSCVTEAGAQADELLGAHESSLGNRVEGQIHHLEQEAVQLRWRSEELSRLSDMQDHVCFLKNFYTMEPLGPSGTTEEALLSREEEIIAAVRLAMKELQESVQELCKASLSKMATIVNDSPVVAGSDGAAASAVQDTVYETQDPPPLPPPRLQESESFLRPQPSLPPSSQASAPPPPAPFVMSVGPVNPEPKTREELLKFRFEPTMDANTAYRHLQLSDRGRKATMRAENVHPTDHPERFHFWRQVLCREPLAGSPYYWEVEWTGQKITIGVTYKEIERKGSDDKSRLGHNPLSWTLYWSGTGFSFWHDGKEKLLGSPKAKQLGVYLDQHAGVLAFYRIASNKADLIHRQQIQFTGPLYAGFRFSAVVGSMVAICQLD